MNKEQMYKVYVIRFHYLFAQLEKVIEKVFCNII